MMRKTSLLLLLFAITPTFSVGCGGSPEEADTSHLKSEESQSAAEAARARYDEAGRKGPDAKKK